MIDAHCHLNAISDCPARQEILNTQGNGHILIDVSIDSISSLQSLSLSQNYDFIYSSLGFHPFTDEIFSSGTIEKYHSLFKNNNRIVAIGEVGLDYKSRLSPFEQEKIFREFIKLSLELKLPVILHNRWQSDVIFDILDDYLPDYRNVIFHCFSEDIYFLERILKKDGNASFSLNVLRKKKKIEEALREIPFENLLLETDSPYMRIYGETSTPLDIIKVYNYAAEIKKISFDEFSKVVYSNAERVFGLMQR